MDRSGATELRKLFNGYREGESAAQNIAGCIVMPDKSIKGEFAEKFLKNEKKTILKYQSLFKKVLGNNNTDISFTDKDKAEDGPQYLLDKVNATNLENKEINRIFYEQIAKALPEGMFSVLLMQYKYDIPIKSKNKEKQSDGYGGDGIYSCDSEEIYTFMIAAISPIKTDKEALGYLEEKDTIGELPQLRTIQSPTFGFLFPNFTDRSSDEDSISCFRTDKLDIAATLFGQVLPKIEKPEPKKKKTLDKKSSDEEMIPSLDTGSLASSETEGQGSDRETNSYETSDEAYKEDSVGDDGMTLSEVEAALNMPRLSEKPVKIITQNRSLVEKRLIGQKQYWIVPVESATFG